MGPNNENQGSLPSSRTTATTTTDPAASELPREKEDVAKPTENKSDGDVAPLSKVLSLARPEAPVLFLALLLMLASEAAGLLNPLILAEAYNDLVDPSLNLRWTVHCGDANRRETPA